MLSKLMLAIGLLLAGCTDAQKAAMNKDECFARGGSMYEEKTGFKSSCYWENPTMKEE